MSALLKSTFFSGLVVMISLVPPLALGSELDEASLTFFETQVRPILAEHCFKCHGPEKQKGELRLDHIDYILKGGDTGPALIAGDAEASKLVEAIRYENVDFEMPPKNKLPDSAIATLTRWVTLGAPWPEEALPGGKTSEKKPFDLAARKEKHWAWQPVHDVSVPEVANPAWGENSIDQFILAKLEQAGLSPAAEADRGVLIRRVYFDLIGLPPTSEEIDAFIADTNPGAYEAMVDRLLASPGFGERWARHWLDLVRYAETFGHEQDFPVRHAWRYRDYVIRALNDDVPYDQFVREHIAGDQLENPRIHPEEGYNESILATGFWFMHQATHAPVDVLQDDADRIDNQIDVLGKAFLGMTVACARCHEHKFDAISERDYYALAGYLQSSRQDFAYLDQHGKIEKQRADIMQFMDEGRTEIQGAAKELPVRDARIGDYLEATHEVLHGTRQPDDDNEGLRPDILFSDFESGHFDLWQTEGDAFGDAPQGAHKNQKGVNNFQGKLFANSYSGNDKHKGQVNSPAFIIERPFITFYIGGGNHEGETCINLNVNGETVLSKTGRNNEHFYFESWDVRPYLGMRAEIEVVDAHDGDWGHVMVDHIVFSENVYPWPIARSLASVARERDLDVNILNQWLWVAQDQAARDVDHPLYAWRDMEYAANEKNAFKKHRDALVNRITKNDALAEGDVVFETFDDGDYAGWYAEGQAFTTAPSGGNDLVVDHQLKVPLQGTAHSGLIARNLQGVLRSKTFTLSHNNIHLKLAGQGAQVRLVIQGYQLRIDTGLLFGGTLFDVNHGDRLLWHNMSQDLSKFKGKEAYLEFIDDGDGWIAVDEIRFSNANPPALGHDLVAHLLKPDGSNWCNSRSRLAKRYALVANEAVNALANGTMDRTHRPLLNWLLQHNLVPLGEIQTALNQFVQTHEEMNQQLAKPIRALAITDGSPVDAFRYVRGNHKTPADRVQRHFLEAITTDMHPDFSDSSGRLALAQEMTSAENPLTARVMVNRLWQHLFGVGIVSSVDNFGVLGQVPSHPELLDHLAMQFTEKGWSIKSTIKNMVMSKTYRMSSDLTDAKAEDQDPANLLLHRMNLRRLEGEVIRDSILKVAGTLNEERFGPSVPSYLSPFMGGQRRPGISGPIDGDGRRSIYQEIRRNYLSSMLLSFDMPTPDTTIGKRTQSNIPQQALILMNDPFVVEQAKLWGETVVARETIQNFEQRIQYLFRRALGRDAEAAEVERMQQFLAAQRDVYELDEDAARDDVRLWSDMCHVMFTLKGFIYVS